MPRSPLKNHPGVDRSICLRSTSLALLALAGIGLAGCGGGEITIPAAPKSTLYPVTGKLVLADGKPVSEGTIRLIPVKQPGWGANGTIQPDGSFTLKTADQGEGVPEGEYRVSIASSLTIPGPKAGLKQVAVPPEYMDEDGSGLKVTIKPSPNDLGTIKLVPGGTGAPGGNAKQTPRD